MPSKARSRRPNRMTSVPPTALGSGARLLDLFPLPLPVFIVLRLAYLIIKHWYVSAVIILFFVFYPDPTFPIIFLICIPLMFYGYVAYTNPQTSHLAPPAVARAAYRIAVTKIRWRRAATASGIGNGPRTPALIGWHPTTNGMDWRPPRIKNHSGTAIEFTLNLNRTGLVSKDIEEARDYLTSFLSARRSRVTNVSPGIVKITLEWDKDLAHSVVANPVNQIQDTQLPRITFDDDMGVCAELDTSILVVGESGSGKSNLTWYTINALNEIRQPYSLYVIDPKKVELSELEHSPFTVSYSDSQATADETISIFHRDMMDTFARMKKQKQRKITLSPKSRLNILIIDELLLTTQARKGIDTQLGEILSAGRAAGYVVIANSQLGQVDAISRLRDLFPQRVCMAVKSQELTDAVLGPQSHARGARCTEITEKGVGYIYTDFAGSFQRFRPPLIPDWAIPMIAQGEYWNPNPKKVKLKKAKRTQEQTKVQE